MASRTMFTDLLLLQEGDVFYIHVLQEVLAYKISEIHTVLPHETELLGIERGRDMCTLVTCTPVGINTHRLLVRGIRVPYEAAQDIETQQESSIGASDDRGDSWQDQYLMGIAWGLWGTLVTVLLGYRIQQRRCKARKRHKGGRYLCKKQSRRFYR